MDRKTILPVLFATLILFSGVATAEPFNVSNGSQIDTYDLPTGGNSPDDTQGLDFSNNGTALYVAVADVGEVYYYTLDDPYDLSTANFEGRKSFGGVNAFNDMEVSPDGEYLFIAGEFSTNEGRVRRYSLSTPYDITTATQDQSYDGGQIGSDGAAISEDGETIVYNNGGDIYQIVLTEAWNLDTASSDGSFTVSDTINDPDFADDGRKFYATSNSQIYQWDLTDPYNVTSRENETSPSYSIEGFEINDDGTRFWAGDSSASGDIYTTADATVSGTVSESDGNPLPNATVSNNVTSQTDTTNSTGYYELFLDNGNYTITASRDEYIDNSTNVTVSGSDVQNVNITLFKEAQLELDIRGYMKHGTTQGYTVTANESGTETVVTSQATVTSSNSTVVSVDQTENELIATSDVSINDVATITAEYQGKKVTKDVTVANRTIDNIGIMPSPQWIPTILGIGESGTGPGGIGSELQWLLVLIMIMYGVTYQTNSASVGIGIGVGGVIVLWVSGYVSVGMLLSTMLFGAFIALTTLDLQNDQTVVHEYR